jgi:hypothetical protein
VRVPQVLDYIGNFLSREIIDAPFSDNAPGSVKVDSHVGVAVRDCLRQAINAGALIHVPVKGEPQQLSLDLEGSQFRLTYLLAPYYKLPLRLGRAINLSSILPEEMRTGPPQKRKKTGDLLSGPGHPEPTLFDALIEEAATGGEGYDRQEERE